MNLRRAFLIAAACVCAAEPALAQFAPLAQQPSSSPWDQAPQTQPWPQPQQQQQQQQEKCGRDFAGLRNDAQKKASALQVASKNKVNPKEACGLFNSFSAAELKMIKYAQANMTVCGVPPQAVDQMKKQHLNTDNIRTKVCEAAARGPAGPAAPTLSDALNAPIADSTNIKTGRGTFDTLTGTPLGPK